MKKLLLTAFAGMALSMGAQAQLLYNMSDSLKSLFRASSIGQNNNTQAGQTIIFDDINIKKSFLNNRDSVRVRAVDAFVYRYANAPATTMNLWTTRISDSTPLTGLNALQKPVTFLSSIALPAQGATAGVISVRFGDSLTTFFRTKADTGKLFANYHSFFLGVSYSDTTGNAVILSGVFGDTTANSSTFWTLNQSTQNTSAFGFTPPARGRFAFNVYGGTNAVALPVTYSYFTGTNDGGRAVLNWATSAEVNNKGFAIERSADGRVFSQIGYVKASGNANGSTYQFVDEKMLAGTAYYRLRQEDKDGRIEFSQIVTLRNTHLAWDIYPNPVVKEATVRVNLAEEAPVTIRVVNSNGQTVQTISKGKMGAGSHNIGFAVTAKGVYQLVLQVGDEQFTKTIVKQ